MEVGTEERVAVPVADGLIVAGRVASGVSDAAEPRAVMGSALLVASAVATKVSAAFGGVATDRRIAPKATTAHRQPVTAPTRPANTAKGSLLTMDPPRQSGWPFADKHAPRKADDSCPTRCEPIPGPTQLYHGPGAMAVAFLLRGASTPPGKGRASEMYPQFGLT
jgi:hypothetical protein